MALIAGAAGDTGGRRPRRNVWEQYWRRRPTYWYYIRGRSPYTPAIRTEEREQLWRQPWLRRLAGPPEARQELRYLPGRALWPEEERYYVPPSGPPPLGPPVQPERRPQVTVRVETEPQAPPMPVWGAGPGWGGGGGGGGGGEPVIPPSPEVMPTPWWDIFIPFREAATGPTREIWIRPQDWAAVPREVRWELERWLRMMGWRPTGVWGRYGALRWTRAEAVTPYWGEEAFAALPERYKAWLWWLFGAKGWAPERERPQVTGWTW